MFSMYLTYLRDFPDRQLPKTIYLYLLHSSLASMNAKSPLSHPLFLLVLLDIDSVNGTATIRLLLIFIS